METYLLDWANLLLRWLHVIVAIAWIGSSFYFVFLDSSLTPPEDEQLKKDGVSGELWAVHGGGFYHPVKFAVSPPKLPEHLHWFYWESYSTWLSGFALFLISYLWSPSVYLIDPNVFVLEPGWLPSLARWLSWWCSGCCTTRSAARWARAKTATPRWAHWCWCWCVWRPGWPRSCSPAARPSC